MSRFRSLIMTGLAVLALAGCAGGSGGEQSLVDRAALTVNDMMTQNVSQDPRSLMRQARGVLICPQLFKAGFFVGGEGGSCVLAGRAGNGTWSYPAFYTITNGSFGFQFGVQDSELMLLIMTDKGLRAVMDSQVHLGANASVAVATIGGGVQGATTAAAGADIVAFAQARGLFGGVSLDGGVMSAKIDSNQAYYGQPLVARQIVLQMQGANPGADPLREVLTKYGAAEAAAQPRAQSYQPAPSPYQAQPAAPYQAQPAAAAPSGSYPPSYQPSYRPAASSAAPSGYQPPPGQYTYPPTSGGVQQQSLPPPNR
jgi:lipid-binding SYLF domain-containing protein